MKSILVTGGAGYIGSHTVLELLRDDYEVIVIDNLSNSSRESIKRVEKLTSKKVKFIELDLLDKKKLREVFDDNKIDVVLHFAGFKAVGESVEKPIRYYQNNITGTLNLLDVMMFVGVKKLVFSSSATVYGDADAIPVNENSLLSATNPYGRTKLFIEEILRDLYGSDKSWSIVILRYFNPIGADESGEIGEDPNGIPNNLLPYVSQVAVGKLNKLKIFGNDYSTIDGTGVRDYIHVTDLALGHIAAMSKCDIGGLSIYNLGTGKGSSVLEVIKAFEEASGVSVSYEIVDRRPGDIAEIYADTSKAKKELDWSSKYDLAKMCEDAWRWQQRNPDGYGSK